MRGIMIFSLLVAVAALSACATMPTGPSVMALPGEGKDFEQFRADDHVCRQYAYEQAGGMAGQQAAQESAVKSALSGTALGAAAGAAIGSASGDLGAGAAIGAGAGLIMGSAVGSNYADGSYYATQRRYDHAYIQCMYAKGNQVPGYRRTRTRSPEPLRTYREPPPAAYPPPPPGAEEPDDEDDE